MTEQELKDKIKLYAHFLKEGNKSPAGEDEYTSMISQVESDLLDLNND